MSLKGIMSVSGMSGLYKLVAQTKSGFIVESLTDKKRYPISAAQKISMLEDKCRQVVQALSLALDVQLAETSIQALLPFLKPEDAARIKNLTDGIYSLTSQARELNQASQANLPNQICFCQLISSSLN